MKNIYQLVPDIYDIVQRKDGWFSDELAASFSADVARRLQSKFNEEARPAGLRLSKMGPMCPKALWHSVHTPELAEPLPPWAEIKFSYGHILEALAITLAKAAGHEVVGEQDELTLDGVLGHRDCVVDGCILDVKSCSSIQFEKYKKRLVAENDNFGYLDQLDAYILASAEDPLVRVKDKGYILAIEKQLGHMCLYEHKLRPDSIVDRIKRYKEIIGRDTPPICTCKSVKDGESGNLRLDVPASYSAFKYCCNPSLRIFLYADGPRYLTRVVRRPADHILEVDRYGNVVYN